MTDLRVTSEKSPPALRTLRWLARVTGLASCAGMAVVAYSQRMNPAQMSGDDLLLFLFFPGAVGLGLVLGWRWDLVGGALAVAGWAAFQLAHGFVVGTFCKDWEVHVLSAAGVIFLLSGVLRAVSKARSANSAPAGPTTASTASETQRPPAQSGPAG